MNRLLRRLVQWLSPPSINPVDHFITVCNGRARFDVAAYLATPEGQARLERLAGQNCARAESPL